MCLITNSKADPTQTTTARRKVIAWLHQCKREALREIKAYADSIPRTSKEIVETVITNRRVYLYELNDTDPYKVINEIINRWYGTDTPEPRVRWFFSLEAEQVVRQSTVAGAERINVLAEAAGLAQPYQVQSILLSQPYRDRIGAVSSRVFEFMKGFTGDTANKLALVLGEEMAAGRGIAAVKRRIEKEFDVSMARAETIARTELAHAHRQTREAQTKDARDRLGLNALDQWISALAATTRKSHAKRHLKFYTPEENAAFYASPESHGGEINCVCSQNTVLIAKDGTVIGGRKMTPEDQRLVDFIVAGG